MSNSSSTRPSSSLSSPLPRLRAAHGLPVAAAVVVAAACAIPRTLSAQQAGDGSRAARTGRVSSGVVRRDLPRDGRHPAGLTLVAIPTGDVRINALFFRAAGPGPHPVLVLLHGFPGAEPHSDLAHAARRAAWHVVAPRYRGAWGSPGTFTWAHVLEDARAVVAWARSDSIARAYGTDPRTVAIVGHSLGGFAALMTAAADSQVAGAASLAGFNFGAYTASLSGQPDRVARTATDWAGGAAVLAGASGRALAEEAFAAGDAWDLRTRAAALAGPDRGRPLLVVGAAEDDVAPLELHHAPLVAALRSSGARALATPVLSADHSFIDVRIALATHLVAWLDAVRGRAAGVAQ